MNLNQKGHKHTCGRAGSAGRDQDRTSVNTRQGHVDNQGQHPQETKPAQNGTLF